MKVTSELIGRDFIQVELNDQMEQLRVHAVVCSSFHKLLSENRQKYGNDIIHWPLPLGSQHQDLLLKELILKLQNKWDFPIKEDEICHCRSISTQRVDQAIISGAHTPEMVSRQTNASTSCGTCRADVEKIIQFRLSHSVTK